MGWGVCLDMTYRLPCEVYLNEGSALDSHQWSPNLAGERVMDAPKLPLFFLKASVLFLSTLRWWRPYSSPGRHYLWQILFQTNRAPTVNGIKTDKLAKTSGLQNRTLVFDKNYDSLKGALSSKAILNRKTTQFKMPHDHELQEWSLHVRPKMSRMSKCNIKTPWHYQPSNLYQILNCTSVLSD